LRVGRGRAPVETRVPSSFEAKPPTRLCLGVGGLVGGVFPFGNRVVAHQEGSWWATIVGWGVGGVLLSHTPPGAVPSALGSLASGFGMGPGGPSPLSPPTTLSPHTPTRGWGSLLVVL